MNPRNPTVAEPFRSIINASSPHVNPMSRHKAEPGECTYCDRERARANNFHPPHDAARNCMSGKHNHCSCDTCF